MKKLLLVITTTSVLEVDRPLGIYVDEREYAAELARNTESDMRRQARNEPSVHVVDVNVSVTASNR